MITIVMRPVKDAKTVNYEGLYSADMGGVEFLRVRARNARHAEEKLVTAMRYSVRPGFVLDYDLEGFKENHKDERDGTEQGPDGPAEAEADDGEVRG